MPASDKNGANEAYALRLLGEIAAQRDPPEVAPAEDYFRQALALAEELGMRPLQAHCHLGLGTLYAKIGRHEQPVPSCPSPSSCTAHGHDLLAAPGGGRAGSRRYEVLVKGRGNPSSALRNYL